jgi:hypothetical protein
MDERRRFQIALGGVASTVFIAGLFVWSAPPLDYPAVRAPQPFVPVADVRPDRPTLPPERGGTLVPAEALRSRRGRPARPVVRERQFAELAASTATTPPAAESVAVGGLRLRTREPRFALSSAPAARGARVAVSVADPESPAHDANARGILTGAFATAGKEVGRGFRTAGRAIKAIF